LTRKNMSAIFLAFFIAVLAPSIRIQVAKADTVNFTLYGSPMAGWGFTSTSMTNPGPTITVNQYDIVNLTLVSQGGLPHNFFVDYNNNGVPDGDEPSSSTFTTTLVFEFNATESGSFTYYCRFHPSVMHGTITVEQAPIPELSPFLILPLFIMATVLAAVAYRALEKSASSRALFHAG
jgi:plastocyanin